ncbi:MAG: histidine kinase [Curvibacter sp.]|nr:histidine kinase [Curvibacter sp.]
MKDTQILSSFGDDPPPRTPLPASQRPALVFDACHTGVVLRALMFVETVMGVAALFKADSVTGWIDALGLLTCAALPATLAWLILACSLKRLLARLTAALQYLAGSLLGGLTALYGCGLLAMIDHADPVHWVAGAASGVLLASLLVAALALRARARTPAATTARLAELQARIRPHFLFNTLNSAVALVRNDPAKAETMLEDLSDLFRQALADQDEPSTLGQELAMVRRYLAIEKIRFDDRLQVRWQLDPRADKAKVPPLLLQPLVENAIKHGVEASTDPTDLLIRTELRGKRVLISISNQLPAPGLRLTTPRPGQGMALSNVRDRLRLLHDVEAEFTTSIKGDRYHVRITLPA